MGKPLFDIIVAANALDLHLASLRAWEVANVTTEQERERLQDAYKAMKHASDTLCLVLRARYGLED